MKQQRTPNDNGPVTRVLANRYARENRGRNWILFAALTIGILTLTIVFGISYGKIQAEYLKAIRKAGNTSSVVLKNADLQQYEKLCSLDYVEVCGRSISVGQGKCSEGNNSAVCSIQWTEKNGWEEIFTPAYTKIFGTYPKKKQDLLLSVSALEKMGISSPQKGMEISLQVSVGLFRTQEEKFTLCGWFTEYADQNKEMAPGYVSLEKIQSWGFNPDENTDILFCQSDHMDWRRAEKKLYEDVPVKNSAQKFLVSDTYMHETVNKLTGGYGMAVFLAVLVLCGIAFLIHNVMQISMAGDIRQMGLLNLIGTTQKQMRNIYFKQILRVMGMAVLTGGVLSGIFLRGILPRILGMQYLKECGGTNGLQVFYHGLLFLSVVLIVALTMTVAAEVIVRIVRISCVESVEYTGLYAKKKSMLHGRRKKKWNGKAELFVMAWRNLMRYQKRVVLVVLSLFLGAVTFLASIVIGQGSDYTYVIEKQPDFRIAGQFSTGARARGYGVEYQSRDAGEDPMFTQGDGMWLLYDNEYDEYTPISQKVKEKLLNIDGVNKQDSKVVEGAYLFSAISHKGIKPLVADADKKNLVTDNKLLETDLVQGATPDVIQILTEEQIEELEKYVEEKDLAVDLTSFKEGRGVLILHDHWLSRKQEIMAEQSVGEPVKFQTLLSKDDRIAWNQMSEEERRDATFHEKQSPVFSLSGYLDSFGEGFPDLPRTWHGAEGMLYYLISEKGFEKLPTEKKTLYMELFVDKKKEPGIKREIQTILSEENRRREETKNTGIEQGIGEAGIFYISSSDMMEKAVTYIEGNRLLLGSISIVLLLAGVTNYFHVVVMGILSRKKELETMEKIGMTKKQMKRMFFYEGVILLLLLTVLLMTVGNGILIGISWYMKHQLSYFTFVYPTGESLFLLAILLGICVVVSNILQKQSGLNNS